MSVCKGLLVFTALTLLLNSYCGSLLSQVLSQDIQ